MDLRPVQNISVCTVEIYFYYQCRQYGLYRLYSPSVHVHYSSSIPAPLPQQVAKPQRPKFKKVWCMWCSGSQKSKMRKSPCGENQRSVFQFYEL